MAIINSITMGKAKKSLGNVTLTVLKTQAVAKQKMTSYTDKNSDLQKSQRNQLKNVVRVWPFFKAYLLLAGGLVRSVESHYNMFVRLFVNEVIDTLGNSVFEILQSIQPANSQVGSGEGLQVLDSTTGSIGVTIDYNAASEIWKPTDHVRAFIYDNEKNITFSADQLIGLATETGHLIIADPLITSANIGICCFYVYSADGMQCGPIQVLPVTD